MEYRKKATIMIAFVFFFMLAMVTVLCFGVKAVDTDKAGTSYEGGIMVESNMKTQDSMI